MEYLYLFQLNSSVTVKFNPGLYNHFDTVLNKKKQSKIKFISENELRNQIYTLNGFENQTPTHMGGHLSGQSTYIIPTNLRDLMLKDSIFHFE